MDHLESSLINRFFEEYQNNTRMHMRVLLFRVFFVIPVYSFFKGRLRVGEMKKCLEWHFEYCARRVPTLRSERNTQNKKYSASSLRVIKQLSSAQTILRSSFAASAFRDAFFVYYSRIVFGYFSQKSTFIKISLPLHLPNPPRVKDQGRTKDEPRKTQRTPNHQKVLFIKIGYLKEIFVTVASAICLPCQMPLSISFTPLCKVSLHSRTSAKMSHR